MNLNQMSAAEVDAKCVYSIGTTRNLRNMRKNSWSGMNYTTQKKKESHERQMFQSINSETFLFIAR